MHVRLPRPLRLGLPAAAVLVLGLAGCSDPAATAPSQPVPTAPSSTPSSTPGSTPGSRIAPPPGTAGSDGLTVRYLEHGTVKTVRVEDFPR